MSAKATPGVHAFRLFGNPGNGNRRQSNCGAYLLPTTAPAISVQKTIARC
jgi:hypothetical protein